MQCFMRRFYLTVAYEALGKLCYKVIFLFSGEEPNNVDINLVKECSLLPGRVVIPPLNIISAPNCVINHMKTYRAVAKCVCSGRACHATRVFILFLPEVFLALRRRARASFSNFHFRSAEKVDLKETLEVNLMIHNGFAKLMPSSD